MWNLTTSVGDFDLSFRPTGTEGYEDLATNAIVVHFAGHDVAVAALADVVRSKEAAGRPKDLATLPALHRRLDTLEGATSTNSALGCSRCSTSARGRPTRARGSARSARPTQWRPALVQRRLPAASAQRPHHPPGVITGSSFSITPRVV